MQLKKAVGDGTILGGHKKSSKSVKFKKPSGG